MGTQQKEQQDPFWGFIRGTNYSCSYSCAIIAAAPAAISDTVPSSSVVPTANKTIQFSFKHKFLLPTG